MLDGRYGTLLNGCVVVAALGVVGCGSADQVASVSVDGSTPSDTETITDVASPESGPELLDEEPSAEPEEEAVAGPCAGPERGPRCDADPRTFDGFGIATLVSSFEVLGDTSCCVDFDDDGDADNSLGEAFAAIGQLERLNAELNESLLSGAQTIVLELDGLDDVTEDDGLDVHVWNANRAEAEMSDEATHHVEISEASIDEGVAPLFSFDVAKVTDGVLTASKGSMELEASFNGVWLRPRVHGLSLTAVLESNGSEEGVKLRDGEIGGHIELEQIYDEINSVAEGCGCLGLEGDLIDRDSETAVGQCMRPDVSACEEAERTECARLVEVCPLIDTVAANIADVDTDGDGLADAMSIGALFESERAVITGVSR